jgi:ribosomal protein L7/L12
MAEHEALPDDVLTALQAGRKADAIKRLRKQQDIDLAEAKRQVDIYIAENPEKLPKREHRELNLIPLLVAAAVAAVAYVAFKFL